MDSAFLPLSLYQVLMQRSSAAATRDTESIQQGRQQWGRIPNQNVRSPCLPIGCSGYTAVGGGPKAYTAEGEESIGCKYGGTSSSYFTTEASLEAKLGPGNSAEAPKGLGVYQRQSTARTSSKEKQPRQRLVLLEWVTLRSSPGHLGVFTAIKFHFHKASSTTVNQHREAGSGKDNLFLVT